MFRQGLELGMAHRCDQTDPLETPCPVYVLMELSGGGNIDLRAILENCLENSGDLLLDGVVAMSRAQAEKLWACREAMVEAQSAHGPYYRTDVSVAIADIPSFLESAFETLAQSLPDGRPIAYGHVGDGNIHLNVVPPDDWDLAKRKQLFAAAEDLIFGLVDRYHGSISAEHGICCSKKRAFQQLIDPVSLDLMRQIKRVIDPNTLFSRGRIFDLD